MHPWLRIPEFKEKYRLASREAVSQVVGHLQWACSVAVLALTDVAQDVDCPASARGGVYHFLLQIFDLLN